MADAGAALFQDALRHHQAGRLADAERLYRQILSSNPRHADALHMLGLSAFQAGDAAGAVEHITKAVAIDGAKAPYHNNLGGALALAGRVDDAVTHYRQAIALQPAYAVAHHNLADVLARNGFLDDAAVSYAKALSLKPDRLQSAIKLGGVLSQMGRWQEAAKAFRTALVLKPDMPELLNNLGIALKEIGQVDEAMAAYGQALALRPDYADAHRNLGNLLYSLDRFDEAISHYQTSLDIAPDAGAAAQLLTWLHYSPHHSDADILKVARAYAAQVETQNPEAHTDPHDGPRDPNKRLRIGYVSPDFRIHPVGFFLEGVLKAHDPAAVEIFCYSNEAYEDEVTARLKQAAHHWRAIQGMPDENAAALIAQDGIDILVDLTGHNDGNRLPLFARRPAPVQVAWLGFYGTTGLSTMDYILADSIIIPPGEDASFTEKVWRLPGCYLCYTPPALDIPLSGQTDTITFGSFNKRGKITDETIAVWSQILKRVAGSRLLLKDFRFSEEGCRTRLLKLFADQGIDAGRITLEAHSPYAQALAAYNRMDIALDTFPFGGCTTTADTLWMGVPLVTLAGTRWTGRMSQSILASMGLDTWAAKDTEDYIEIACRLATGERPARPSLRQRLKASGFCDAKSFARQLEDAYRGMWQQNAPQA